MMLETHTNTPTKIRTNYSYFYDGDGLRVSRTDNITGLTTYYVWDTENPTGYPQVVEEIEGGQVIRRYGYGHFLENIDIWNGSAFERFYVVRDGTNSVRMLLDSTGFIAATYDYDAFGNVLSTLSVEPGTLSNPYGFHSEYRDPTTGLVYLRARWYEPREGRFLCKDEFEGALENPTTLNKYISFNNNPTNMIDPEGYEGIIGPTGARVSELLKGIVTPEFLYYPPDTLEQRQLLGLIFAESNGPTAHTGAQESATEKIAIGSVVMNRIYYINEGIERGKTQNLLDFGNPDVWSVITKQNQFGSINNPHWKLVFSGNDLKSFEELNKDLKKREHRIKYNLCNDAVMWLTYSGYGFAPIELIALHNRAAVGLRNSSTNVYTRLEYIGEINGNHFFGYKKGMVY